MATTAAKATQYAIIHFHDGLVDAVFVCAGRDEAEDRSLAYAVRSGFYAEEMDDEWEATLRGELARDGSLESPDGRDRLVVKRIFRF